MDRMDWALDRALDMSEEEQKTSMDKMYQTVTTYDVKYWADHLFKMFQQLEHQTASGADTDKEVVNV
jgi:glucosylglycerol-phosphate synthase